MAPKAKEKAAAKPAAKQAAAKPAAKKKEEKERDPADDIPKVAQPDRAVFEEQLRVKDDEINKLQAELSTLAKKIGEKSHGKDEFLEKKGEIQTRLNEKKEKFDELMAKREGLQKQMGVKRDEDKQARQDLNKMKKSLAYTNADDINNRIAEIEYKMNTEVISLKEEKDLLKEISQLKKDKPKVAQFHNKAAAVEGLNSGVAVKDEIKLINEMISQVREEKMAVSAEYKALMDSRTSQTGDMQALFDERDQLNGNIRAKVGERSTIRQEFREQEREFRAYQDQVRAVRQQRALQERNKREEEWKKKEKDKKKEKLLEEPFVDERALLSQTILWCKSVLPKEEEEKTAQKEEKEIKSEKGLVVLSKKEDRDEFYFEPTKKKGAKGKKAEKKDEGGPKPIKHNMETFTLFDKLKVNAPMTTADIPAVLEKLEEQMEGYNAKVQVWQEKMLERAKREAMGLEDESEGEEEEQWKADKAADEEKETKDEEEEKREDDNAEKENEAKEED